MDKAQFKEMLKAFDRELIRYNDNCYYGMRLKEYIRTTDQGIYLHEEEEGFTYIPYEEIKEWYFIDDMIKIVTNGNVYLRFQLGGAWGLLPPKRDGLENADRRFPIYKEFLEGFWQGKKSAEEASLMCGIAQSRL